MKFWDTAAQFGFEIPKLPKEVLERTYPGTECCVLDGKAVSQNLIEQCRNLAAGRAVPHLTVILVGDDPASHLYVRNKETAFRRAGFRSSILKIKSTETNTEHLLRCVDELNQDRDVHGILIQLPLPAHIDTARVISRLSPEKDVDGFSPTNLGKVVCGRPEATLACTPFGVLVLLASFGYSLASKNAVVVGRSQIVGRPMGLALLDSDATVTWAHSKTRDLKKVCRNADILIVAAGKSSLIQRDFVSKGAVVVDVGINKGNSGQVCGDVEPSVTEVAAALSPVPGGVGPMTIAMLCINTALAAWR